MKYHLRIWLNAKTWLMRYCAFHFALSLWNPGVYFALTAHLTRDNRIPHAQQPHVAPWLRSGWRSLERGFVSSAKRTEALTGIQHKAPRNPSIQHPQKHTPPKLSSKPFHVNQGKQDPWVITLNSVLGPLFPLCQHVPDGLNLALSQVRRLPWRIGCEVVQQVNAGRGGGGKSKCLCSHCDVTIHPSSCRFPLHTDPPLSSTRLRVGPQHLFDGCDDILLHTALRSPCCKAG